MPLTTSITARIAAALTGAADHGTPKADLDLSRIIALATGVSAGQADQVFSDQRTINASANDDLDLAGVLTNVLGASITFAKVKAILIVASSGNTNNVVVGNAAANAFSGPFSAAATFTIHPGGFFFYASPSAGYAVTAGTGDILRVANSAGGTTVLYDIVIIGTTA